MALLGTDPVTFATPKNEALIEVENAHEREIRLLRTFSLIAFASHGTILLLIISQALLSNKSPFSLSNIAGLISLVGYLGGYKLARTRFRRAGSWSVVISVIVSVGATYWLSGTMRDPVPLALLVPIVLALVLLNIRETIFVTTAGVTVSSIVYIMQNWNSGQPTGLIVYAVETAIIVAVILALLIIPSRGLTKMHQAQNRQLRTALIEVENRQRTGQQFSQQVLNIAADLTSTAGQQATGSQQQVTVITQVDAAVSELSVTAANIDELTDEVSRTAHKVASDSRQIAETTNLSVAQSEKGLVSARRTLEVSREVGGLYQHLLATMNELTAKNARMRHILNLLKSIADETHLLALNASIEAGGAGVFGERFSVVAQEVKNLASRSAGASKEVFGIVREVEEAALAAESSAHSGYTKAKEMEVAVGETEQVIGEMRQIAEHSQAQASSISQATSTVKTLTEQIKASTAQQRKSSEQVTEALTGLTIVAKQSASGSQLVSATALSLEQMSHNLNETLVTTNFHPN